MNTSETTVNWQKPRNAKCNSENNIEIRPYYRKIKLDGCFATHHVVCSDVFVS